MVLIMDLSQNRGESGHGIVVMFLFWNWGVCQRCSNN